MTDIARLGMEVDSSGLRDGQRELQNLVGEGAKAESAIEGQSKRTSASWGRMAAKAGLAVAAIGTGITLAVRGQLNEIDRLAKDAQRLALPVDMLSQMQHAAEMSGASIEGMQRGLRNVSRTMVNNGDRFEELGIAIRGVDGEMRPVIDVFEDAADQIAAMEDGADKTALAMQLFGERAGPELIPMLNQGRDGIRAMREEADRLGLTISEDTAQAAQAFNDNITRLTGAGRGLWRMISAELAPTLEKFSGVVVDLVGKFGEMSPRMRSLISNGGLLLAAMTPLVAIVGAFVGAIALIGVPAIAVASGIAAITAAAIAFWPEIKAAAQAVYDFAKSIGAIEAMGIVFDGLRNMVIGVRDVFVAVFQGDIPGIMEGLVQIMAAPIQAIVGLWRSEFAAPLRETIGGVVQFVKDRFNELMEWLASVPARMFEIGSNIIQGLRDGISEAWEGAKESIRGSFSGVVDMAKGVFRTQSPSVVFHEIGMNISQGLANGIRDAAGLAVSAVQQLGQQVTGGAFDMAKGVVDAMGQMFQGSKPIAAAQALINTFQGITEALKLPFPASLVAAAKVAAQGFAAVKGIQSARPGSTGGAASSGGGAAAGGGGGQAQASPRSQTEITLVGEFFSPEQIGRLLNEFADQGGRVNGDLIVRTA